MSIYAIADLHLSFQMQKPMDIFGNNWTKHEDKIRKNWESNVKKEDFVLLPGDFSWAMSLEETCKDFEYLSKLPGKKILSKGNHDYWWNSLKKLNKYLEQNELKNINFLHNNAYECEGRIIARNKRLDDCIKGRPVTKQ